MRGKLFLLSWLKLKAFLLPATQRTKEPLTTVGSRRKRIDFSPVGSDTGGLRASPKQALWVDNQDTGQCSVFDSRPDAPYPEVIGSKVWRAEQLSIKRWCHGEIRVSLTPRYQPTKRLPKGWLNPDRPAIIRRICGVDPPNIRQVLARRRALVRRQKFADDNALISGYGGLPAPKILSRYSARQLEEVSEIGTRKFGTQGIFLTATLPGSEDEGFKAVAQWSGYLVKLVRQWIRDSLSGAHAVFGAWEFQKRGALHLHACVLSEDKIGLELLQGGFQQYWRTLLLNLGSELRLDLFKKNEHKTWIDDPRFPRCDAGWLRKSPAKYLGKYCGKDAQKTHQNAKYFPSRWTTVDRKIAAEAASERVRLSLGSFSPGNIQRIYDNCVELLKQYTPNIFDYKSKVYLLDTTTVAYTEVKELDFIFFALESALRFGVE